MAKDDIKEVNRQEGTIKTARRFDDRDWKYISDFIIDEFTRRKEDRKDREKYWKDIDRQIAMEPEIEYKKLPDGTVDRKKAWMAEMELPLQAQALEVLTADARQMMFPDSGPWFRAHAEMTDDYLQKANFKSIILGDELQVPSEINQDNCDKLVEGFLSHIYRQYDHTSKFDIINAESFKYGMGVGRARMETKNIYINESRGVRKEKQRLPVIVPCSIRNLYLDSPRPSMHSSQVLGPAHIAHDYIRYENLVIAARKGSNDPDNEDGGWMPDNLKKVVPDKKGYVQVFEMEGDIIVPRKTVRSVVIPGAIITVAMGGAEKGTTATRSVVRFRFRKHSFSSYLLFPYHYEGADDTYPTGPLMKGRPVQMMATDALNRCLDAAMLKNAPPVGYDPTDLTFTQSGGPEIYPYAQWETTGVVKVHNEVGGDPTALASLMAQAVNLYAELTGVFPARLGAQTLSHTTASAKQAELQRGAVRTVDYVNQSGHGPITRWLDMSYRMGREELKKNQDISFFIDAYGGFVEINKDMLPENVSFEWFGSGGPQDKRQKTADKMAALQLALKMDQMAVATGKPATIDIVSAIKETLREGGWSDLENITSGHAAIAGASGAPGVPGASPVDPGTAIPALQALTG